MKRIYLKIGDVIEIPLPNGKKGFVQYVYKDWWGDLVGIYDYVVDAKDKVDLNELARMKFKFYPILPRIKQGIRLSDSLSNIERVNTSVISLSDTFLEMAAD